MPQSSPTQPIGAVLQQAGLISDAQVSLALQEQTINQHRLGNLFCEHGWLKEPTADFFAEQWPALFHDPDLLPLGQYFRLAHLLTDTQIDYLLEEQYLTQLRFGVLAVANGWVKLKTLNFFLTHLHLLDPPQQQPSEVDQAVNFDTPEYWQYLREYLLENELANPYSLLQIYEQILTHYDLPFTGDLEQTALLNLGLVTLQNNYLLIAHPLFRSVFNGEWIQRERKKLHPYDKIRLQFLNLSKAGAYPYRLLEAILSWTNNHDLLNQKIAHLVRSGPFVPAGEESHVVEQVVQRQIIQNWRAGFATKHLSNLEEQILQNSNCDPIDLLTYYQVVWHQFQTPGSNAEEETELIRLGLLARDGQTVKVANQIYRLVFDQTWLEQQISQILAPLAAEDPLPDETEPDPLVLLPDESIESGSRSLPLRKILVALLLSGLGGGAVFWAISRQSQIKQPTPPAPTSQSRPSGLTSPSPPQPDRPSPAPETAPEASSTPSAVPIRVRLPTATQPVPIFSTGTTEADIQAELGPPTEKSPGYWPNSYGLLYKNIQPNQTDFGFLLDVDTQQLRQTEAAFVQATDLGTLRLALKGMLNGPPPKEVLVQLTLIYQRQAREYEFRVGALKGIIQRNEEDRIYLAVWDKDFH